MSIFQTNGKLIIKVIEVFCSSFNNIEPENNNNKTQKSSLLSNKKISNINVADVMSEVKIISVSPDSDVEPIVIHCSRSIPTLCSLLPKEGRGNCLIGDEIELDNVSSNSTISVTLLADLSKSFKNPDKNFQNHIIELGYVDIPMQRLEVDIPITQWYQLLNPWTKENVQSTVRIELLYCERIDESKIVANKSMKFQRNGPSESIDNALLSLDIEILPGEGSEASSPDINPNKKELVRPEALDTSYSFDILSTKSNDETLNSLSNKRLPVGLVDYFILVGPIESCTRCPLHSSNTSTTVMTNVYTNESMNPKSPLSPTMSNALECKIWDRFPKIDYTSNPLPNKIEWFVAPEGPQTMCCSERPSHRLSSFVLSTGDNTGQQYGIKLRFFYQIESPCQELLNNQPKTNNKLISNKVNDKSKSLSTPWLDHIEYNRKIEKSSLGSKSKNTKNVFNNSLYISVDLCILSQYSFINQLSKCLDIIYIYYILPALIIYEKNMIEMNDQINTPKITKNTITDDISNLLLSFEHIMISLCLETPTPIPTLYGINLQIPIVNLPNYLPNYIYDYINNELRTDKNTIVNNHISYYNISFSSNHCTTLPECSYPLLLLVYLLGPRVTLTVLNAVLSEARILFHTQNLSILPIICECIVTLLYPLKWSHVYLPIVPLALLDVIEAPVPYMLGTNSLWIQYLSYDCLNDVVVVDCDNNSIDLRHSKILSFPDDIDRWLMLSVKTIMTIYPINCSIDSFMIKHIDKSVHADIFKGSIIFQLLIFDVMISLLRNIPHCLFYLDKYTSIFNRPLYLDEFVPLSCISCIEILSDTNAFHRFIDMIHSNEYNYFIECSEKFPTAKPEDNNLKLVDVDSDNDESSAVIQTFTPRFENQINSNEFKSLNLSKTEKLMTKTMSFSLNKNVVFNDIIDSKEDSKLDLQLVDKTTGSLTKLNKKKSWHNLLPQSPFMKKSNQLNDLIPLESDDDFDIPSLTKPHQSFYIKSNEANNYQSIKSPTMNALINSRKLNSACNTPTTIHTNINSTVSSAISSTVTSTKHSNEIITDLNDIFNDIITTKSKPVEITSNITNDDFCLPDWIYFTLSANEAINHEYIKSSYKNKYYSDIIKLINNRLSIYHDCYNNLSSINNDPILTITIKSDHDVDVNAIVNFNTMNYKSIDSFINPELFVDIGSPIQLLNAKPFNKFVDKSSYDSLADNKTLNISLDRSSDIIDNKSISNTKPSRSLSVGITQEQLKSTFNNEMSTSTKLVIDRPMSDSVDMSSYSLPTSPHIRKKSISMSLSNQTSPASTNHNMSSNSIFSNRVVFPRRRSIIDSASFVNVNISNISTMNATSSSLSGSSDSTINNAIPNKNSTSVSNLFHAIHDSNVPSEVLTNTNSTHSSISTSNSLPTNPNNKSIESMKEIKINNKIVSNKRFSITSKSQARRSSMLTTRQSRSLSQSFEATDKSNEDIIKLLSNNNEITVDMKVDNRTNSLNKELDSKVDSYIEINDLTIDTTTNKYIYQSKYEKIIFDHIKLNILIGHIKLYNFIDISNYLNISYEVIHNKYINILNNNSNNNSYTYNNRYIKSNNNNPPTSLSNNQSTNQSNEMPNKSSNIPTNHWLDKSPSHAIVDPILLDYLKIIISGTYINDIEFYLLRKQCYSILIDTKKRKYFIDILKQSNSNGENKPDSNIDKVKLNYPIFFPLNNKAFNIMIDLFIEVLHICIKQNNYLDAYELLIASGLYFNVGVNSNDVDQPNEPEFEFLSSHIIHHPIYQKTDLWKAVLNNRIVISSNPTSNASTNLNIRKKNLLLNKSMNKIDNQLVILETRSIIYMMSSLGINPERSILLIQDIIDEYKLDVQCYIDLKQFVVSLYPIQFNSTQSNIDSYNHRDSINHDDHDKELVRDVVTFEFNSDNNNNNNNAKTNSNNDIDKGRYSLRPNSISTVNTNNNINKTSNDSVNKPNSNSNSNPNSNITSSTSKSWFSRKFFSK